MVERIIIRMRQDASEAEVRSPFSAKDIIKDGVPTGYRWWDADRRCWLVDTDYIDRLTILLKQAGWDVTVSAPPPASRSTGVAAADWAVATFNTCATKDQVDNMHRALLRVHHPDKGGSPAMVEQINAAADTRRKQVY